jgi:hypothetical protein
MNKQQKIIIAIIIILLLLYWFVWRKKSPVTAEEGGTNNLTNPGEAAAGYTSDMFDVQLESLVNTGMDGFGTAVEVVQSEGPAFNTLANSGVVVNNTPNLTNTNYSDPFSGMAAPPDVAPMPIFTDNEVSPNYAVDPIVFMKSPKQTTTPYMGFNFNEAR